jgi:hypothetical protein
MAFDSFNPAESLIPNDGDLVFDATTGEGGLSPAETVLPYIEQRADPDTIYRPGDELTAGFCATGHPSADGSSQGNTWAGHTAGDGASHDAFPTETVFPTETIHPYEQSVHTLYDLVM